MNFKQYLARQLSHPTGLVGKFVLAPLWNRRNAALNEAAFTYLVLKEDDRVLDIGFGGGYLLGKIILTVTEGFAAGIDVSPVMVENCRTRYQEEIKAERVDIQCGQVEELPYPDGCFSKISSVNSIFYWDDAEKGISEIYRVLEDGGLLVLTFTCKEDLGSKGFARHGVKVFEAEEVEEMLVKAGFRYVWTVRGQDQHRAFVSVVGRKNCTVKKEMKLNLLFTDKDAWNGGFYELAIELPPEVEIKDALTRLWSHASLEGSYARNDIEPADQDILSYSQLKTEGHLYGVATFPNGKPCACGSISSTFEDERWLTLYLPLSSLANVYPVHAYPFGDENSPSPEVWLREVNEWMKDIALHVFELMKFPLAMIGFEMTFYGISDEIMKNIPDDRWNSILLVQDNELKWYPQTIFKVPFSF